MGGHCQAFSATPHWGAASFKLRSRQQAAPATQLCLRSLASLPPLPACVRCTHCTAMNQQQLHSLLLQGMGGDTVWFETTDEFKAVTDALDAQKLVFGIDYVS